MTFSEQFRAASKAVVEALSDPKVTVGASVKTGDFTLAGNMDRTGPGLLYVLADDHGRFWKEGNGRLICILDLRQLSHAMDSGPSGGDLPADHVPAPIPPGTPYTVRK